MKPFDVIPAWDRAAWTGTVDFTGTVIHGTSLTEDLIPAFLAVLDRYAPKVAAKRRLERADDLEFVEKLFDDLEALAPEGYTFGSHPGDGSDYGFWEVDDVVSD